MTDFQIPAVVATRRRRRTRLLALFALTGAIIAPPAAAIDEADLLPVDQAFVLSADATSPESIAIRWKIADGYYLYKHRISAQTDAGFAAQPLQLPKGKAYTDEFFGKVETYRDTLVATLAGRADGARTTLKIKYQGCADAGICYPPQTRTIVVPLVAASRTDAPPATLGSNPGASRINATGNNRLLAASPAGAIDALPLPPERAFGFEAIADDGNTLLLRFTPAPGYYLYRDKTTLALDARAGKAGVTLGKPRIRSAARSYTAIRTDGG